MTNGLQYIHFSSHKHYMETNSNAPALVYDHVKPFKVVVAVQHECIEIS